MKNQTKKVSKNTKKLAYKVGQGVIVTIGSVILLGLATRGAREYLSNMSQDQRTIVSVIVVALLAYVILSSVKKLSR